MPSWGGILKELGETKTPDGKPDFDKVRRKYLALHYQRSKRATILYATKWTDVDPEVPPAAVSIAPVDVQGFMEACYEVQENQLDLILHSPGGSLEAAEAVVDYLRQRFDHIRVIVPHAAMSAGTIIACAADEIVMGEHSSLGPIDPQFFLGTPLGRRVAPAQAILDQFELAKKEIAENVKQLPAWAPMLQQFGPDLLVQCANLTKLSHDLVQEWLEKHMFKGNEDAAAKGKAIADWLADHNSFQSHSRHIPRHDLEARGMKITHLEADAKQQDNLLSIFHAVNHTLTNTSAVKIIENHKGNAFVNHVARQVMMVQGKQPGQQPQRQQPAAIPAEATPATPAGEGLRPPFKKKFPFKWPGQ